MMIEQKNKRTQREGIVDRDWFDGLSLWDKMHFFPWDAETRNTFDREANVQWKYNEDRTVATLKLAMPGAKKDQISLSVEEDNGRNYIKVNFPDYNNPYYVVNRFVLVPQNLNIDTIQAVLSDGVLSLSVDSVKPKRKQIEIKVE